MLIESRVVFLFLFLPFRAVEIFLWRVYCYRPKGGNSKLARERFLRLGMAKKEIKNKIKNTRNSINISLKLYFNIKVKGDLNISTKISTDRVA